MAFVSATPLPIGSRPTPLGSTCGTQRNARPVAPKSWRMTVSASTAFKDALLEKVVPLNFGRVVAKDPAAQEEIDKLARQVEATNKSFSPGTDPNVSGAWKMVYTTSKDILGVDKPKFLQGIDIVQEIDAATLSGKNREEFQLGPLKLRNAVEFKLTPTSPSRFDVNFVKFVIFGLFRINVEKDDRFTGWLEVTYLDEDLRISRGNKGNLFVLVK